MRCGRVANEIGELGSGDRLIAARGDIGTVTGCESTVASTLKRFCRLDVLGVQSRHLMERNGLRNGGIRYGTSSTRERCDN